MKSTTEVATELGISSQRLRALAQQGRIRPKPGKIGEQWIFADSIKIVESENPRHGIIEMVSKRIKR